MEIQEITNVQEKGKVRLAIMASGRGSNAQEIIKYSLNSEAAFEVALIVSNNPSSGVIEKAKRFNIHSFCIDSKNYESQEYYEQSLLEVFHKYRIEMIALAGYLKLIPQIIIDNFSQKIFNIHPSLLPKYGGKGMYGLNVHKIIIKNREQISGASVHIVESEFDTGEILSQKSIQIHEKETPETLAERVLLLEHGIYAPTLNLQAKQLLLKK